MTDNKTLQLQPLVSIVVATYNSEKFVLETLESAKIQTWQNIELIVSDDCSSDNTVASCRNWMAKNKDRFIRAEVITVPENTGVSANCNRCIKASNAEWIKLIAGDDVLLPNCVEDNMRFVAENRETCVLFSQVLVYENEFLPGNLVETTPVEYPMNLMNPAFGASEQFKLLLLSDRINYTPSYFFRKQALLDVGGYDEDNRFIEDYPMWLKLTSAGTRLHYFHKATVGYRRHRLALNNTADVGLFKPLLLKSAALRKTYVYPYLPWDIAGREKYILSVSKLFQLAGLNKKTVLCSVLYKMGTVYLNPFRYIIYFRKKLLKPGGNSIFYAD